MMKWKKYLLILGAMLKISIFEESIVMKSLVGLAKIPIHLIQKYSSSHLPYELFCALVGIFIGLTLLRTLFAEINTCKTDNIQVVENSFSFIP